jgi:hypothetical protein
VFLGKVLISRRAIAHRTPGASSFPNSAPNSEPESGLGGNTLVADDVDNPTRSWNAVQSVTTDNVTVPFQWESTWGVFGGAIKPLLAQLILCPAVITPSIITFPHHLPPSQQRGNSEPRHRGFNDSVSLAFLQASSSPIPPP